MDTSLVEAYETLAAVRAFNLSTRVSSRYDGAATGSLSKLKDELVGRDWESALGKFIRVALPVYLAFSIRDAASARVGAAQGRRMSFWELTATPNVQKALLAVFAVYFIAFLVVVWRNIARRSAVRAGKAQADLGASNCEQELVLALTEARLRPHDSRARERVTQAVASCKRVMSGSAN